MAFEELGTKLSFELLLFFMFQRNVYRKIIVAENVYSILIDSKRRDTRTQIKINVTCHGNVSEITEPDDFTFISKTKSVLNISI